MEFNAKFSSLTEAIIIFFFGLLFTQCSNESDKINCNEINRKSIQYINQYYIDNDKRHLDSALFYIERGINNCSNYENVLSLRKLSVLSEQQNYLDAIEFIESFDKEMFSDLPYYQELLINRFRVMKAINQKDINKRNKYLEKCVTLVEDYLGDHENEIDSLFRQSNIENILNDPLSTALTQYYYYKSLIDFESVNQVLNEKLDDSESNNKFINYLIEYLQTDFMEFNGI